MDFNDYPTEQKSIPWKPVALAAAGVLVVVVIMVVLLRVFGGSADEQAFQQYVDSQVEFSLDQCEGADDEEGCRNGVINNLATEYGSDETCEMHSEDADRDNCYWLLAMNGKNTSYCGEIINDDNRVLCADGINAAMARETKDTEYCERIMEDVRKQQCLDFLESKDIENDCINGSQRPECDTYKATQAAIQARSEELCEAIENDAARESCIDAIASSGAIEAIVTDVDSDGDGLSDEEEATYGTDPENSDTDGDGYPDGDEVLAGYNPLGEGTLE
jgi:hypothetical protein